VGTTGVDRVVERSAQLIREHDTTDIGSYGGIPLDIIQKYINFHYTVSLDLFGSETSTNAANYYTAGLKGRWQEGRRADDHRLTDDSATVERPHLAGTWVPEDLSALLTLNLDLRGEYIADCETGVKRWNKILADHDLSYRLRLPHPGFCRAVGMHAGFHITPDGTIVDEATWALGRAKWLPTDEDLAFVRSLMHPVRERGKIAGWVAPPRNGINGQPFDYEYVHLV
ncbi:MAG TPA: benzoyl-CoA 2,3-epoxidase subunit BoxB, partial [Pseudonocardiaceae bacterium]|nr:benzoyl-CoA 2,3-epoxidase subunit BoxB [Pseudonocardiaceae bacterium]